MALAQAVAAAIELYAAAPDGSGAVTINVERDALRTVPWTDVPWVAAPVVILVILAIALVALAPFISIIWIVVSRSRQRARLIELAIQNNQPEIAREIAAKQQGGGWKLLLWIIFFIAALTMLGSRPTMVFVVAGLALVVVAMGSERRANMLRGAAGATGKAQEWLAGKAAENEAKAARRDAPPADTGTSEPPKDSPG